MNAHAAPAAAPPISMIEGTSDYPGQASHRDAEQGGDQATHEELALGADVEQSGPEAVGDRETREDERRRTASASRRSAVAPPNAPLKSAEKAVDRDRSRRPR